MKLNSSQLLNSKHLPPEVLKQILQNPVLMEKLSDRVYELLREDLQRQRERNYGYGRRF